MAETGLQQNASSAFFENRACEYFPCHTTIKGPFNCLFCYCPLYHLPCKGSLAMIIREGKEIKDCSGCDLPHRPENYTLIVDSLRGTGRNGERSQ